MPSFGRINSIASQLLKSFKMSTLLRFILLLLSVSLRVNGGKHHLQQADIIYVDGHTADDIKTGPRSAKHQISSQDDAEFNNNNQNNYYQNPNQGNNPNARYIVQTNGAPTIQTIYESSSGSPILGYHQTSSESSSQNNNANSHQSSSTTASTHKQFIQPEAVVINSNPGYIHPQITDSHGISQGSVANHFSVNQYIPTTIETSSVTPGYQTTTSSSENSFESSTQSSSTSSNKTSSQFNSQATTPNPTYYPEITHVTTPYSVHHDTNQHGTIAGSSQYLPPFQTNYVSSSTPATTVQTFESSSTNSSSEQKSSSQSSSQSNQKTSIITTGPAFHQPQSISMSVTPTPYTISVSTPQTYEISHPAVPITPIVPGHQPVPIFKPIIQPPPFSVPAVHNSHPTPPPITHQIPLHPDTHAPSPQPTIHYMPPVPPAPFTPATPAIQNAPPPQPTHHVVQPAPFIPAAPVNHHSPPQSAMHHVVQPAPFNPAAPVNHHAPPQSAMHHVPVVTESPVTQVQEHHGVIEKTINVPQPGIKTQTYEIRRPAIQKQFYDIEERVIVRPAGSVVFEIDHPLSKTAKGGEVIVPIGGNAGQGSGISHGYNNGPVYTHGTSHGQNSGTVITENQNQGNTAVNVHGNIQGQTNDANYGHHQFISTGGNNYLHVFGYYPYPNICDQYLQKFIAAPSVSVSHPSNAYVDQQYQPPTHGVTSTTINPFSSTTTAPLNIDDDDSVVINAKQEYPSTRYIDSTTQASQLSLTTTEIPLKQNSQENQKQHPSQQQPPISNIQQMPHMISVGDPDFRAPPYVEIRPNGQAENKGYTNVQTNQQPAIRGDLHNTGAHTLYTMQTVMNDEYFNQHPPFINPQPQQVNFNQKQQFVPNKPNNDTPHIVYAISARNPNSYIAPQQRQLVFSPQSAADTIQHHVPYDNSALRQQVIQSPQPHNQRQFISQHSAPYIVAGNQQSISHSPVAYSSSFYNQRIPNFPINVHFSPNHQGPKEYHYTKNLPNDGIQEQYKNPRLNTGPSVIPQQEYEKNAAAYTQPQNYVNGYQQYFPTQQIVYNPNAAFTQAPASQNDVGNFQHQLPPKQILSNQNNQPPEILTNQGQQEQSQQNYVQGNNTQLNQGSPVQIYFNESDSYPMIDIRNNIDNKIGNGLFSASSHAPDMIQQNTKFNGNSNETNNQGHSLNPPNNQFRGDILQQQDSQPQSSSINGQYENDPNLNIKYQPNENQKQLLDFVLSNHGSSNDNANYPDLNSKGHIISATPAPKYSEPAGERVHTRRIVVNQPLETVQVVHEQTPVTNYKQVTVQQPTVYKTSKVGLKRIESSVPIFIQPQHLPGFETNHYNSHHQPISYSYFHRQ